MSNQHEDRWVVLGGGCFWGVEEIYWQIPGVTDTSVGYAGGTAADPSYRQVCSGTTGHAEVTRVQFDPEIVDLATLFRTFFTIHDPTQGMRQGNDVGSQYRSAIFTETDDDAALATELAREYQGALTAAGEGEITTEIGTLATVGDGRYWPAEEYHQKYLAKNPHGYRCHSSTGVAFPGSH